MANSILSPESLAVARSALTNHEYLDLLKRTVTRALFARARERHTWRAGFPGKREFVWLVNRTLSLFDLEVVRIVRTGPESYLESGHAATNRAEDAESMLGMRQFDNMQACILDVVKRGVPGDLLEAGVWRGGMTIFMRGVLKTLGVTDRKVWAADSFEGLPAPDHADERSASWWHKGDMAESLETVRTNFARYGLLDEQVMFLQGFFSKTLPDAPIRQLAVLRMDADLYQSTADVLQHLYPRLSPGGYLICDDYLNLHDCRRAVDEYRAQHGITEPIREIDQRAIFWQKRSDI
jgi:O-methyltransferase